MSRDASNDPTTQEPRPQEARREKRFRIPRLPRVLLLAVVVPYVSIAAMLTLLQRKLIYFPFKAERITAADAELPPGRVHDIRIDRDDGPTLHGWHVLAEGHTADDRAACDRELAEGRPVVLFFSGNGANRRYRVEEMKGLLAGGAGPRPRLHSSAAAPGSHAPSGLTSERPVAAGGADVFIFDYRGYGDNEGSPSEEGLTADARAVWNYAARERGVSPDRLVLYGESLGGAVAVGLAAEMCKVGTPPAGLIVRSGFSSLADTAAHHYPWLPVRWLLVDRYPAENQIASVTCPILVFHGDRDRIVPIALGRKLFEAAPERSSGGVEKRFVELTGADHNGVLITHGSEIRAAVREFFATAVESR